MKTFRRTPTTVLGKRGGVPRQVRNNNVGGKAAAPVATSGAYLLEDGASYLLLEDGSKLLLE